VPLTLLPSAWLPVTPAAGACTVWGERVGGKVQPSRRDYAGIGGRLGHPEARSRIKGAVLVVIGALAGAALASAFLLPAATGKPSPGSPTCINDGEASPLPKNGDIYFCRHGQSAPQR
jgi:hypothetical protein